jgi:hypothetical protein
MLNMVGLLSNIFGEASRLLLTRKSWLSGAMKYFISFAKLGMVANPLPFDRDRQLEKAGTYRNLEIVVLSTLPRCTKVFVVFAI